MMHSKPLRGAIFDIDGTLAMMDKSNGTYQALPGAIDTLNALEKAGIPVVAYTNGTFFPPAHYYPRLADAGLNIAPGHVMTPASVAADHLGKEGYRRIMVLGDPGTHVPLQEAGFEIVAPTNGHDPVEAVMIGWTRNFGINELEAICEAVWAGAIPFTASDAPFFASAKGRMLGISGAISAMVVNVTGKAPVVLGKPSVLGMEMSAKLLDCEVGEIVVIGDDPELEIAMARKCGAFAVGVTTGLNDTRAFQAANGDVRADLVLGSLAELPLEQWFSNVGG